MRNTIQPKKPVTKAKTIDIEVSNVDGDDTTKSSTESFVPSSQSNFVFKPKFYKPNQVTNTSTMTSIR